jgi:predicted RNA methylase
MKSEIIKKRGYSKSISGDDFSLYISSYPESVLHVVKRIVNKGSVIAELCCGIGVTSRILCDYFDKVTSVDNDPAVMNHCRQNLSEQIRQGKSQLIIEDAFNEKVLSTISADIVIYDVPYWSDHDAGVEGAFTKKNPPLKSVVEKIRKNITNNIVIFSSPNVSYEDIVKQCGKCEYEKVYINDKHDRNHIYLGELMIKEGQSEVYLKTQQD